MAKDIIRISDEEAHLQCEVTRIALSVLETAGGSELFDLLNGALETGNLAEMRCIREMFEALPAKMRLNLLFGFGPPAEAEYAVRLLQETLHDLIEGESAVIN